MRINNKKLKNRKKLLLDFVSNKEYQPMRAKDIAMLLQIPKGKRSELFQVLDELEAEVKWVLAYVSYNEQRYDDMEQLLMQPQVLERHPWGTYLIALGHRMQQSDNNQMSQDLQMLIQNSQNINLTMEEKGDINVMIASLLSEGYGNAIGMGAAFWLKDTR